jgi:hypothetical protein
MADDFDLWELIAAPIKAMNEAEAGSATRFVELLLDYALEPVPAADPKQKTVVAPAAAPTKLREVSFQMRRPTAPGQTETREITLPLLQLVPIGGVSINEATLNYGLSMSAARAASPGTRRLFPQPGSSETVTRFTGRLAQTSGLRSTGDGTPATDANITIEIKLKQMDLPQGVLDLLQHTQGGIDSPVGEQGGPATTPPVNGNGPLFSAEILGMSGKVIQPGERFSLKARITPGELSKPLHVSLSSQPGKALNILEPGTEFDLTSVKEIDIVVFVSNAVKDYKPDTRVAVVVHGTSTDQNGSPLELTTSLFLPRNQA